MSSTSITFRYVHHIHGYQKIDEAISALKKEDERLKTLIDSRKSMLRVNFQKILHLERQGNPPYITEEDIGMMDDYFIPSDHQDCSSDDSWYDADPDLCEYSMNDEARQFECFSQKCNLLYLEKRRAIKSAIDILNRITKQGYCESQMNDLLFQYLTTTIFDDGRGVIIMYKLTTPDRHVKYGIKSKHGVWMPIDEVKNDVNQKKIE